MNFIAFHALVISLCALFCSKVYATDETALRTFLKSGYDHMASPTAAGGGAVQVSLGIHFYKVESISISTGVMRTNAWIRTQWNDPRLIWDPSNYGGITKTTFFAEPSGDSESEIWVPDVEFYNGEESLYEATRKPAQVSNDGTVYHSRPSTYSLLCSFKGANLFPYSIIYCDIELGGWSKSGSFVDYNGDLGINVENYELNPEYSIVKSKSSVKVEQMYFDCCPNEPWPLVTFSIAMKTESFLYTKSLVLTNVALVYLNFATLWLDIVGRIELLGLGATYVLTMIAVDYIASTLIPISSETLWIEEFLGCSLLMAFLTVVAVGVSVYYDFVNDREMERFDHSLKARRAARNYHITKFLKSDNVHMNAMTSWEKFRWGYARFCTPGGLLPKFLESWGVIHYGHLVKFASGFFLPVLYALIIISLGSQLATSEVHEGYHLGIFLCAVGSLTVVICCFSVYCEMVSRANHINPKVSPSKEEMEEIKDDIRKSVSFHEGSVEGEMIVVDE